MNVDFNNVRKQAAYRLDDLTKKLNGSISNEDIHGKINGRWETGNMLLNTEDIQEIMDDLRVMIMTINYTYEEGNPDFKDNMDVIERNGGVAWFNREDEDDE